VRTLIGYLVVLILAIPATPTTPPAPPLKAKGSDSLYLFKDNGKWGYLDRNGAIVIPAEFDAAGDFFEGLAPATKGDARGYINTSGKATLRSISDLPQSARSRKVSPHLGCRQLHHRRETIFP
jgi:hypothetical protein